MPLLKVLITIKAYPEDIVIETTCKEDMFIGDLLDFYQSEIPLLKNKYISLIDSVDSTTSVDRDYQLTTENFSLSKKGYVQIFLYNPSKGNGGPGKWRDPSKLKKKELILEVEEHRKEIRELYSAIDRLNTFNSNRKAAMYKLKDRIEQLEEENIALKSSLQ